MPAADDISARDACMTTGKHALQATATTGDQPSLRAIIPTLAAAFAFLPAAPP